MANGAGNNASQIAKTCNIQIIQIMQRDERELKWGDCWMRTGRGYWGRSMEYVLQKEFEMREALDNDDRAVVLFKESMEDFPYKDQCWHDLN